MLYRIYQRSLLGLEFSSGKFFLKTKKVFYSKKCQVYIYKIRSLLSPCNVFYSDKTSRLHAAQKTAPERPRSRHTIQNCLYISLYTQVSNPAPSPMDCTPTWVSRRRGPLQSGAAAAVPPRVPVTLQTNRGSTSALPKRSPSQRRKVRERKLWRQSWKLEQEEPNK